MTRRSDTSIFFSIEYVSDDKQTKKEIRERALQAHMEKTADGRKEKAVKKQQEKKYALETMMKVV